MNVTYVPGTIQGNRDTALGKMQSCSHGTYSLVGEGRIEQIYNVLGPDKRHKEFGK